MKPLSAICPWDLAYPRREPPYVFPTPVPNVPYPARRARRLAKPFLTSISATAGAASRNASEQTSRQSEIRRILAPLERELADSESVRRALRPVNRRTILFSRPMGTAIFDDLKTETPVGWHAAEALPMGVANGSSVLRRLNRSARKQRRQRGRPIMGRTLTLSSLPITDPIAASPVVRCYGSITPVRGSRQDDMATALRGHVRGSRRKLWASDCKFSAATANAISAASTGPLRPV